MPRGGAAAARAAAVTAAAGLLGLVVVLPVLRLAGVVGREGSGVVGATVGSAGLRTALEHTLALAAAVTLTAVPIGTTLALVLRRPDLPGRAFWRGAVLLPLVVPDFVLGYSWSRAYGVAGFTDSVLGVHWAGLLGADGVGVVLAVHSAPLAYLVVAVGLAARAEPDLERAARASGAGPATTLVTVTLPLVLPALAAASVLVFVLTLGSFAIPQILGTPGGFGTVTTRIYADLSLGGDPASFLRAVTAALLLVVVAAAVVTPSDLLLAPRLRATRPATTQGLPHVPRSRAVSWAQAAGLALYLALTLLLPLAALALASITRALGVPPTPANWSLVHFREVLTPRTAEALARSVVLAGIAATVLLVLGGLVAGLVRHRAGRATATLITLPLVLPGSTLAVALLITYGRWLGGTSALILLAYVAKLWAFAHRPIAGALDRLPPDELRASRVSGAGPLTAVRTVVLRPLAPALLAAWMVCFLTALHEVTMSSLLYGPGSETLAVVVLNSEELGRIGPTAALSVTLTLLVAAPALVLWAAVGRLRIRSGRG